MSFAEHIAASRRLALLRLIARASGGNESVLAAGIRQLGFPRISVAETRDDLRWLEARGLILLEWVEALAVAKPTQRGLDAAAGRGPEIEGLERPSIAD